jgi:hypothetical protein
MARALTLAHVQLSQAREEILRRLIVCGCAIALIAAGQSLPV